MATSSTRDLTDVELDKNWKPSGRRPQSTMARNFSDALNDLFKIDNSIADLDAKVDQKKRVVSLHTNELKELEERLRAMEERLKATSLAATGQTPSPRSRTTLAANTFAKPQESASPSQRPKTASRPNTARKPAASPNFNKDMPPLPGQRPPTPGESQSEEETESSEEDSE